MDEAKLERVKGVALRLLSELGHCPSRYDLVEIKECAKNPTTCEMCHKYAVEGI